MTPTDAAVTTSTDESDQVLSPAHLAQEKELLEQEEASKQESHPYDFYRDQRDIQEEDVFLDRPLWESRYRYPIVIRLLRACERLYHWLYGDLPVAEFIRTLHLASTLFFMIGGYWLLRSLKDPVLTAICGVTVIPKAKMLSVVVVLCVVSFYNHLLDHPRIPKHTLFYLFGSFYFICFTVIAILLQHPTIGLPNQQQSAYSSSLEHASPHVRNDRRLTRIAFL
jgi:TLC ATP/ADP transporter